MSNGPIRCVIVSDFTIENFAAYLRNGSEHPSVHAVVAPFGLVRQSLADDAVDVWNSGADVAIVWTRPEAILSSYRAMLESPGVDLPESLDEVNNYAELLAYRARKLRYLFVPTWLSAAEDRGFAMLDMKPGAGAGYALLRANLHLIHALRDQANVHVLDAQRWLVAAGKGALNPRLWYSAKIPFGHRVFKEAAREVKAALTSLTGMAKKVVVLDLDHTLWGGVVGDVGWENIRLGGHDPLGEAYVDFQRALKSLKKRGILLAIASKNEEPIALEVLQRHPEMVLRADDFTTWRINWDDKASNILSLMRELNLGLESAVFIDDDIVERARVREALPEVLCPDWPDDPMLYRTVLARLPGLDAPCVNAEDLSRTQMYSAEQQRHSALAESGGDMQNWLTSLDIAVTVTPLNETNLCRTAQLLNKTNQMNLSTRRLSEQELQNWAEAEGHALWTFRVADKFGDSGLTGIASLEVAEGDALVLDFILSCRVFGRDVERAMMHVLVEAAGAMGAVRLKAHHLPTAKNKPCLRFLERSGLERIEENHFAWELSQPYPLPKHVRLVRPVEVSSA